MSVLLRTATWLASPGGSRGRLAVFMFHRTLERPDPLLPSEPDARMFDRMLGWIGGQFRVLEPVEACEQLFAATLPARAAIITFDDGYRDHYTVALPALQRHRMQAVFFIATGYLDGSMMFNDRVIEAVRRCGNEIVTPPDAQGGADRLPTRTDAERRAAIERLLKAVKHLPPNERETAVARVEHSAGPTLTDGAPMMMSPDQVAGLHRAGMCIGGHTRNHPILVRLDAEAARSEIASGFSDLAAITGARPRLFAYPNGRKGGDFDDTHAAMLEALGVDFAFTTHAGVAHKASPRFELPRFTPWDRSPLRFGACALLNVLGR